MLVSHKDCLRLVSEICEGLANTSGHRFLRGMLKRGQLARVSSARSCSGNVEEAILKALRAILPVAEFTQHPDVFLNISSRNEIDRKTLTLRLEVDIKDP